MRDQIDKTMADGMKQVTKLMAWHPSFTEGTKEGLAKEGHIVTDKQIEDARKILESGKYEITFTNNVNHLNFITNCEEFHRWFLIKKWRFYLAKGSKKFITSDNPIAEVFNRSSTMVEKMYSNHIAQRRHYFALTPEILIELINPLTPGKRQKRHAVDNDRVVIEVNRLIANYSKEYAYSSNREYLDDLLQFYVGSAKC
jgi:hypothetical protein